MQLKHISSSGPESDAKFFVRKLLPSVVSNNIYTGVWQLSLPQQASFSYRKKYDD